MRFLKCCAAVLFAAAILVPLPSLAGPSATCDRNKQACMSGSAQTGNFGARFVPPDAVRMCMDQYRACIGRR
jgi:hypothetical protein